MQSKDFIKNKLIELIERYHNISIEYYFDKFDNDHFLLIHPSKVLDDILKNYAMSIDMEFIDLFPNESLNFIISESYDEYGDLVFSHIPSFSIDTYTTNILLSKDKEQTVKFKDFRTYSSELYYSSDWIKFKAPNKSLNDMQEEIDDVYALAS